MSKFSITKTTNPVSDDEREQRLTTPVFGRVFTDHMAVVKWNEQQGWHDPEIKPYAPLMLDPACAVLHYAQEIFEGMKAYKTADGKIALFRPQKNAERFRSSARRMEMPELPEDLFMESIAQLVALDKAWVPGGAGSLYLRPFMFASAAYLGVKPSHEYLFLVIASPVGNYFSGGKETVTIWAAEDLTRAAPGGTGAVKCGGNYAASLAAQGEAYKNKCDQVIFLDAVEHKWIEELGGMNVFFVMENGELITPPLTDTVLPGITRDSIITLARDMGMTVHERRISFREWQSDAASSKLLETFACGTAAAVAPIGEVRSRQGNFIIGNGGCGEVAKKLRTALQDIQYGRAADKFGWVYPINS